MGDVTRWLTRIATRAGSVLRPRAAESRMEEEFRFHVEMETARLMREGLAGDAARRRALLAFGGVERHKEEMRDERGRRWADEVWLDVRFGVRQLRKNPGFTIVMLLTLALGVGATVAIFTVANGIVFEPLAFGAPGQLVHVESSDRDGKPNALSPLNYLDYRDQSHSFEAMAPVDQGHNVSLTRPGQPAVRVGLSRVGSQFFSLLDARPARGRFFVAGDDAQGAPLIVVLSDAAWRNYFGADTEIVGRAVSLDGKVYTVVGVAAPALRFPDKTDVWIPMIWYSYEVDPVNRAFDFMYAVARVRRGVAIDDARHDLQAVAARLARQYPKTNVNVGALLQPLQEHLVGNVRPALLAMLGAVGFVLLIVCANVANLLLVRAAAREPEIAVRTALGAGRPRLIRQLATEHVLLALGGTLLGVLGAWWAVRAVVAFGPQTLPRLHEIVMDGRVVLFAAGLAIVTGLLFGLVPALHAARADLSRMLRRSTRGSSHGGNHTRDTLVIVEMSLAVILLVGAGLLTRSFVRLMHVDPGFRTERVIAFDASPDPTKYPYDGDVRAFADNVIERLEHLPGTENVAVGATRPLDAVSNFDLGTSFTIRGRPSVPEDQKPHTDVYPVSPDFFRTMGIRLTRGRTFTPAEDRAEGPPTVVVNDALARRYFPHEDPIGQFIVLGMSHNTGPLPGDTLRAQGEIIGIVADVKQSSLADTAVPATYLPYGTLPFGFAAVVRTTANQSMAEAAIRAQMRQLDPDVPVFGMGTVASSVSASVAQPRFYMILLGSFAGLALVLAAVGIYGVLSYAVSQRSREIGIRIALGASSQRVAREVLGHGLRMAVAGVAIGLAGAVAFTRFIAGLLYGVQPLDVPTLAGVSATLIAAAFAACFLPARRAARADPLEV
ncbi:MAG TPA: ABC transporter permease, partial [Gemmatimonadaceae bacterium]|nr:ABC transporter permease [Gemmatimonadaceae bacterium]